MKTVNKILVFVVMFSLVLAFVPKWDISFSASAAPVLENNINITVPKEGNKIPVKEAVVYPKTTDGTIEVGFAVEWQVSDDGINYEYVYSYPQIAGEEDELFESGKYYRATLHRSGRGSEPREFSDECKYSINGVSYDVTAFIETLVRLDNAVSNGTWIVYLKDWTGYTPISTPEELNAIRNNLSGKYYLTNDIVFTDADFAEGGPFYNDGAGWEPIGSGSYDAFAGTFDGAKHTITGLQINITSSQTEYAGLFGFTRNAKINNIVLVNADIYVQGSYACIGGIAGYTMSTHFDGCESSGAIESSDEAGGIVGYVQGGSITNCHNSATVISSNSGGGIVGATDATVSKCSNTGDISSIDGSLVGGIVGYLYSGGNVTLSYNTGNISAIENRVKEGSPTTFAGGICGEANGASIRNCFNIGTIRAEDVSRYAFAGGIAGSANIYNCYNIGDVSSSASEKYYALAGGIVGDFDQITENCYYLNTISKGTGRGTDSSIKCSLDELADINTFDGFDFETVWEFCEGNAYLYPTIRGNDYYLINENADFQGGDGAFESPFLIASSNQLNNVRKHLGAHFKLVRDITFDEKDFSEDGDFYNNGNGWTPIGTSASPFTGEFNGNNYTIKNLYINDNGTDLVDIGFFGKSQGNILNVNLADINYIIDSPTNGSHIGGLVGYLYGVDLNKNIEVFNCTISGMIFIENGQTVSVGGVIGDATLLKTTSVSQKATIQNCVNQCSINTEASCAYVGGIVGRIHYYVDVLECVNLGDINVDSSLNDESNIAIAGGIVGRTGVPRGEISYCYNTALISAKSEVTNNGSAKAYAGGIVGYNNSSTYDEGLIQYCYNIGKITSITEGKSASSGNCTSYSGGICGYEYATTMTDCFNAGEISGYSRTESYNYATAYVGGIVGCSYSGELSTCYNVGVIDCTAISVPYPTSRANHRYGAIIGNQEGETVVNNCIWLNNTFCGIGELIEKYDNQTTKRSFEELLSESAYSSFDFDTVWTMGGNSSYLFPELQNVEMQNTKELGFIAVTTDPVKTEYLEGKDDLNLAGGKLMLYYNNGTTEEINLSEATVEGFDNTRVGGQTLTVTYNEKTTSFNGKPAIFEVKVIAKSLVSIAVTTSPSKTEYLEAKDPLNLAGGKLTLYYNNDTTETVDLSNAAVTGFNNTKVGEQILTVSYYDYYGGTSKSTTFKVNIIAKTLTSIAVTTKPSKLTYLDGDSFDASGMVVTAYYDNGTSEPVTEYTFSGYSSTVGTKTIKVTYGGKSATFTVTVNSRVPSAITSDKHTVSGGNIGKITAGTSTRTLLANLNEGSHCKVYNGNIVVSADNPIGTGMVVKIMDGNTVKASYTAIVTGDVNGDGGISVTDMISIKAHLLNKSALSGAYGTAADTNGDGVISITDFIQIKAQILKKGDIVAR